MNSSRIIPGRARRLLPPLALAAVAGLGLAGINAPALAQKKDKKEQAAPKANYSKEFIAAYKPLEPQLSAATADYTALKAALPAVTAAATTPDDKMAAGRAVFSVGQKTKDFALALQGIDLVLASGRADRTTQGQFAFVGAQLAYNLKDYAKSRTLYQTAIDAGYTENDPELGLADAYFSDGKNAEGLKYLSDTMAARKAAGTPVSEAWVKRALATAYNNKLYPEARQWATVYAREFPSQTSWGDAIAINVNTADYAAPEMLDLLRLARRTGTLRTRAMVLEYVDAADARKLPKEVIEVLDYGKSAKLLDETVPMAKDARTVATGRLAADAKELPSLQRDANAAGAKLVTVMAAADTLLSYSKFAEAEALYAKAAGMAGANVPLVLTRQGIAQLEQGKHAEAQATFAKVQGNRKDIAALWSLYATQKAAGVTIAPAASATAPVTSG